jgi:hypothetical protein
MSKTTKDEIIKVRDYLIMRAKMEKFVHYQELSDDCNLKLFTGKRQHMKLLGDILTAISSVEKENGRPILSSLVVTVKDKIPGPGYEKVGKISDFKEEQDKCYYYWNDESNFDRYISLPEDQLNRIIALLEVL